MEISIYANISKSVSFNLSTSFSAESRMNSGRFSREKFGKYIIEENNSGFGDNVISRVITPRELVELVLTDGAIIENKEICTPNLIRYQQKGEGEVDGYFKYVYSKEPLQSSIYQKATVACWDGEYDTIGAICTMISTWDGTKYIWSLCQS